MESGVKTHLCQWVARAIIVLSVISQLHCPIVRGIQPSAGAVTSDANMRLCADTHAIRIIDDPAIGGRWLLFPSAGHSPGPGRLVRIANLAIPCEAPTRIPAENGNDHSSVFSSPFVIRSGETLRLEQHTKVLDAQLEATALEDACFAEVFKAQVKMNGKIVLAIAIQRGQAVLDPADGAKR